MGNYELSLSGIIKKPRMKLTTVEKRLLNGTISSIKKYFHAAIGTACLNWWNSDQYLVLEQENCSICLRAWLIKDVPMRPDTV